MSAWEKREQNVNHLVTASAIVAVSGIAVLPATGFSLKPDG
jgi:hypothetical protein